MFPDCCPYPYSAPTILHTSLPEGSLLRGEGEENVQKAKRTFSSPAPSTASPASSSGTSSLTSSDLYRIRKRLRRRLFIINSCIRTHRTGAAVQVCLPAPHPDDPSWPCRRLPTSLRMQGINERRTNARVRKNTLTHCEREMKKRNVLITLFVSLFSGNPSPGCRSYRRRGPTSKALSFFTKGFSVRNGACTLVS